MQDSPSARDSVWLNQNTLIWTAIVLFLRQAYSYEECLWTKND